MKWTHLTMANQHILLIISFLCLISDLRKDNIGREWTFEVNRNNLKVGRLLGWLLVCEDCLAMGVTSGKRKNKPKKTYCFLSKFSFLTSDLKEIIHTEHCVVSWALID